MAADERLDLLRSALNGAMVSMVNNLRGKRDGVVLQLEGDDRTRVEVWAEGGELRFDVKRAGDQ